MDNRRNSWRGRDNTRGGGRGGDDRPVSSYASLATGPPPSYIEREHGDDDFRGGGGGGGRGGRGGSGRSRGRGRGRGRGGRGRGRGGKGPFRDSFRGGRDVENGDRYGLPLDRGSDRSSPNRNIANDLNINTRNINANVGTSNQTRSGEDSGYESGELSPSPPKPVMHDPPRRTISGIGNTIHIGNLDRRPNNEREEFDRRARFDDRGGGDGGNSLYVDNRDRDRDRPHFEPRNSLVGGRGEYDHTGRGRGRGDFDDRSRGGRGRGRGRLGGGRLDAGRGRGGRGGRDFGGRGRGGDSRDSFRGKSDLSSRDCEGDRPRDLPPRRDGPRDMNCDGPFRDDPRDPLRREEIFRDGPRGPRGPQRRDDPFRSGPREPPRRDEPFRDGPREPPRKDEPFRDGPREPPRRDEPFRDGPRELPRREEPFRDGPRELPRRDENFRDGPRELQRRDESFRDRPRELQRRDEPFRDSSREPPRRDEMFRDGPRELPQREEPREFPNRDHPNIQRRDGTRDLSQRSQVSRDGQKEFSHKDGAGRDGPRDFLPRDGTRELQRHIPRDLPRVNLRDGSREGPREGSRDGSRDLREAMHSREVDRFQMHGRPAVMTGSYRNILDDNDLRIEQDTSRAPGRSPDNDRFGKRGRDARHSDRDGKRLRPNDFGQRENINRSMPKNGERSFAVREQYSSISKPVYNEHAPDGPICRSGNGRNEDGPARSHLDLHHSENRGNPTQGPINGKPLHRNLRRSQVLGQPPSRPRDASIGRNGGLPPRESGHEEAVAYRNDLHQFRQNPSPGQFRHPDYPNEQTGDFRVQERSIDRSRDPALEDIKPRFGGIELQNRAANQSGDNHPSNKFKAPPDNKSRSLVPHSTHRGSGLNAREDAAVPNRPSISDRNPSSDRGRGRGRGGRGGFRGRGRGRSEFASTSGDSSRNFPPSSRDWDGRDMNSVPLYHRNEATGWNRRLEEDTKHQSFQSSNNRDHRDRESLPTFSSYGQLALNEPKSVVHSMKTATTDPGKKSEKGGQKADKPSVTISTEGRELLKKEKAKVLKSPPGPRVPSPPPKGNPTGVMLALARLIELEASMEYAYAKHMLLVKQRNELEHQYKVLESLPVGIEAIKEDLETHFPEGAQQDV